MERSTHLTAIILRRARRAGRASPASWCSDSSWFGARRSAAIDTPVLRAVGMTRSQIVWAAALPAVVVAVAGAAIAVAGAIALSPLFPTGLSPNAWIRTSACGSTGSRSCLGVVADRPHDDPERRDPGPAARVGAHRPGGRRGVPGLGAALGARRMDRAPAAARPRPAQARGSPSSPATAVLPLPFAAPSSGSRSPLRRWSRPSGSRPAWITSATPLASAGWTSHSGPGHPFIGDAFQKRGGPRDRGRCRPAGSRGRELPAVRQPCTARPAEVQEIAWALTDREGRPGLRRRCSRVGGRRGRRGRARCGDPAHARRVGGRHGHGRSSATVERDHDGRRRAGVPGLRVRGGAGPRRRD